MSSSIAGLGQTGWASYNRPSLSTTDPAAAAAATVTATATATAAGPDQSRSSLSSTAYSSPSTTVKHGGFDGDGSSSPGSISATTPLEPARKKQKRNKPTLSCAECVERKTKCDRGRPHCLACIKRQTECRYAEVANLLEVSMRSATNPRRITKPPKTKLASASPAEATSITPTRLDIAGRGIGDPLHDSIASFTSILSNVPYSNPTSSNVFGIGREHPFANYWTCSGGLPELINVLPEKIQSDILLSQYFECVDSVYPMLQRQTFYADYEHFWSLSAEERGRTDAAFVALIFVMLAMGMQFVTTDPRDRKQTAEFYASASNQALRVGSYLSTASLRSVQAMVLLTYFLINDNHASDGWAFAGILMRQAYAMGLHRDPNIVAPNASLFEKQQRRKLWQAVLLQDTFLTVLLSLPPSATHTDVDLDDMDDSSSIAASDPTDMAYIRGSWALANLVQETICSPRSLDLPICTTQRQKQKLISDFRAVYRSFPDIFRSWDAASLSKLAETNKRVVRQTLFLASNYHHNVMLVHASESGTDVPINVRGALDAAHEGIMAFFMLYTLFGHEASVWWVFNHRAFLEALCIGAVLRVAYRDVGPDEAEKLHRDPSVFRARADIARMVQIMMAMAEDEQGSDVAKTRVAVLSSLAQ